MFDSFCDSQDVAYAILKNSILNNKLSHAYLFDASGYDNAFSFVLSFAKVLVCSNSYCNYDLCGSCNICKRIDDGNFTEVKIIEASGLNIKKEQLMELQSDFSLSSIESLRRVYIIRDCDKMTAQAANSLLKFLEEPNDNVVALLLTSNFNNVLGTIISRCQVIKLKNVKSVGDNEKFDFKSFYATFGIGDEFLDDDCEKKKNCVFNFIKYFENNGLDAIINLKKLWFDNFKNRVDNVFAVGLLINFYYDVLRKKIGVNDFSFLDSIDFIEEVSLNNTILELIDKVNICVDANEMLKCNLNVNLLICNMIIELDGVRNGACSS